MRSIDLAPLSRSTIGYDRMMQLFENASRIADEAEVQYPPYDIAKLAEDSYRITMAVAGFGEGEGNLDGPGTGQADGLGDVGPERSEHDRGITVSHRRLAGQE